MDELTKDRRLAVLVDAENSPASVAEGLMGEIAKYGVPVVRRIYGDWSLPHLKSWKEVTLTLGLTPVHQFGYTKGKNATDSIMIIQAMDLLYSGRFDGFCIVSSDSDFTPLASRIREEGILVYGFGERKTPTAFVSTCDRFIFTEVIENPSAPKEDSQHRPANQLKGDTRLVNLIRGAIESSADDDGWAHLGAVGHQIGNQMPEFDARHYGYRKLSELIEAIELFELRRQGSETGSSTIYVRDPRQRR